MNTTETQINLETYVHSLRHFTAPDHPICKDILSIWNYRGDGTQRDADRMRLALGEKAYEHYNWDTAVTNGRVLILFPRYKHPESVRPPIGFHLPAEWFWCFSAIEQGENISAATPGQIATVPVELRESLSSIRGLEWLHISHINVFVHGDKTPHVEHRRPPEGVLFFRFDHGVGLSVAVNNS